MSLTTTTVYPLLPLSRFLTVPVSELTLVAANLVMNYSPHLSPDTQTAPEAVELRRVLVMAAEEMLEVFLRRWRGKMGYRYASTVATKDADKGRDKEKERVKAKGKAKAVDPTCQVRRH